VKVLAATVGTWLIADLAFLDDLDFQPLRSRIGRIFRRLRGRVDPSDHTDHSARCLAVWDV
jgi:hypothetical protein